MVVRIAFEAAGAGEASTPGKSSAAAEIDGLLGAVLSNVDKLVNMLEHARSAAVPHGDGKTLVPEARLPALLQQLLECV